MNVYEVVTDRILSQLEKGIIPWRKEWKITGHSNLPLNFVTRRPYRGINVWLLLSSCYPSAEWITYKQAQAIGAQVRKGEKGTQIIFWSTFDKSTVRDGASVDERIPFARTYTVFNVAQCDGIPAAAPAGELLDVFEPIPAAAELSQAYLTRAGIPLNHGGDRAYYHPSRDCIQMPLEVAFATPHSYYSTLFHECSHSTGHSSRLDRGFAGGAGFGSVDYSKEELVAEFGAAYLCAEVGISNESLETNQVAYIQGWMKALKNDKTLLVSAAQKAQRAADLILDRVPAQAAEEQNLAA